eukprot:3634265-Pyramimonas_sp.AAC.1
MGGSAAAELRGTSGRRNAQPPDLRGRGQRPSQNHVGSSSRHSGIVGEGDATVETQGRASDGVRGMARRQEE